MNNIAKEPSGRVKKLRNLKETAELLGNKVAVESIRRILMDTKRNLKTKLEELKAVVSLEKQILNVINRLQKLERCTESCKNIEWALLNPENETKFTEFRKAIEGVNTAKKAHQNADNKLDEAAEATRE